MRFFFRNVKIAIRPKKLKKLMQKREKIFLFLLTEEILAVYNKAYYYK